MVAGHRAWLPHAGRQATSLGGKRSPPRSWGWRWSTGDEPGRSYLRMDYWHHRIVLEENGADD